MDTTNRLEEYIAELTRTLRGGPSDQIALEVAKVRGHFGQLINQNRIAGLSESDAVDAAIAQYSPKPFR